MPTARASRDPPFEPCDVHICSAPQLEGRHCLEHLTSEEFDAAVIRLRNGDPLDARTVTISSERLHGLLDALKDDDGRPALPVADFGGATFSGDASFGEATFSADARFGGATFSADAEVCLTQSHRSRS